MSLRHWGSLLERRHDQVFQLKGSFSERCVFLTTEECCSSIYQRGTTLFDAASTSHIRRQMQIFVKTLHTAESLRLDDPEGIAEDSMRDDPCDAELLELPVDDTFDMDVDTFFMDQLLHQH